MHCNSCGATFLLCRFTCTRWPAALYCVNSFLYDVKRDFFEITSHSILLVSGQANHWEGTDLATCSTLSVRRIPVFTLVRTLPIIEIQPSRKRPSSFQPFPFAIPVQSIAVKPVSQPHRQHLPCTLPLPSCVHPVPSKSFANSDPLNHVGMRSPDKNKS